MNWEANKLSIGKNFMDLIITRNDAINIDTKTYQNDITLYLYLLAK